MLTWRVVFPFFALLGTALAFLSPVRKNCNRACTRDYRPQCGSDGKTYGNKCMLEVGQCKNPALKLLYSRECGTNEGFCPRRGLGECRLSERENKCNKDTDCSKSQKCCATKCGKACVNACEPRRCSKCPTGEKPETKQDKNGCMFCECVKSCKARICRPCLFGRVKDASGCPTCKCQSPPYCKERVTCYRPCFSGYKRNKFGCRTCKCRRPRVPCPKPRCPPGCKPWERKYVQTMTGCSRCTCLGPLQK